MQAGHVHVQNLALLLVREPQRVERVRRRRQARDDRRRNEGQRRQLAAEGVGQNRPRDFDAFDLF